MKGKKKSRLQNCNRPKAIERRILIKKIFVESRTDAGRDDSPMRPRRHEIERRKVCSVGPRQDSLHGTRELGCLGCGSLPPPLALC